LQDQDLTASGKHPFFEIITIALVLQFVFWNDYGALYCHINTDQLYAGSVNKAYLAINLSGFRKKLEFIG
jgi:hypothetical protein